MTAFKICFVYYNIYSEHLKSGKYFYVKIIKTLKLTLKVIKKAKIGHFKQYKQTNLQWKQTESKFNQKRNINAN